MPDVTLKVMVQDIKKVECESIVAGFFEDVRPLKGLAGQLDWLLCGSLSRLISENRLRGSLGDIALLTARGKVPAQKIFLIGLGMRSDFSLATLTHAARNAAASVTGAGATTIALEYIVPPGATEESGMQALREGLSSGAGERQLAVVLLAQDAAACSRLAPMVKA